MGYVQGMYSTYTVELKTVECIDVGVDVGDSSVNINTNNAYGGAAQLEVGYLTVSVSWPSALNCNPCNHAPPTV